MKITYKDVMGVHRPLLLIRVMGSKKIQKYEVLIDSGADVTIFHTELAELVGIDLSGCEEKSIKGIGDQRQKYFETEVYIMVGKKRKKIKVGFAEHLGTMGRPYGIAGQLGFFEHFKISFDYKNKVFQIKENK